MSYETAVARMFALGHELAQVPSHKFDLAHMRVLLKALDHPERRFPSVLIAGTNGKGSTAATLASILRSSGLKTGLYTSPHLIKINERIRVNGEEISDHDFAALQGEVDRVAEKLVERAELPWHPSFFEIMTAIAFEHFAREKVDLAVLEVGMGGRLDATNVVDPRVSCDHRYCAGSSEISGNTVGEIAREKVGIIRPGGAVVTLPQLPEANDVIGNTILDLGARAVNAVPYVPPVSPGSAQYLVPGTEKDKSGFVLSLSAGGSGRGDSGGVAFGGAAPVAQCGFSRCGCGGVEAAGIHGHHGREHCARHSGDAMAGAVSGDCGAGGRPEMVLDVAHNPAGAWALRAALSGRV